MSDLVEGYLGKPKKEEKVDYLQNLTLFKVLQVVF